MKQKYQSVVILKKAGKCQRLSSKGKQCNKLTKITISLHLNDELYDEWARSPDDGRLLSWVRVYLCNAHISQSDRKKLETLRNKQ